MSSADRQHRPRARYFHRWFGYVVVALISLGGGAYGVMAYLNGHIYHFHDDGLVIVRPAVSASPSPNNAPAPLPPYDQSIRQQNLDKAFRPSVPQASAAKAEVVYAELTGDRTEDALVVLHLDGSGGYIDAAVYTMANGTLKQIWRLPATDRLAVARISLGANQSLIYTGAKTYDAANTRIDTAYNYIWNATTFAKVP